MRAAFSVGTKLLGVYFIYLGLFSTISSTISLVDYSSQTPAGVRVYIIFGFLSSLLQLTSGVLLVVKTEWFVRLAGIEETTAALLDATKLLQLGVTLLGVATFVKAISPFLSDFSSTFSGTHSTPPPARVVWVNFLNLAVALGLIVFAKRISATITRWQSS